MNQIKNADARAGLPAET